MDETQTTTAGFHHLRGAWYARYLRDDLKFVDEVLIARYYPDGSVDGGEITVRWYDLVNGQPAAPRLEVFHDAWRVLASMPQLLGLLATLSGQPVTPQELCDQLRTTLDMVDRTPRHSSFTQPRGVTA